jgi:hypothetical protein
MAELTAIASTMVIARSLDTAVSRGEVNAWITGARSRNANAARALSQKCRRLIRLFIDREKKIGNQ